MPLLYYLVDAGEEPLVFVPLQGSTSHMLLSLRRMARCPQWKADVDGHGCPGPIDF
jgi:hypothetical protein